MTGMFYSPYGCPFSSPFDVYMAYMPAGLLLLVWQLRIQRYPGYYGYPVRGYGKAYNTVNYRTSRYRACRVAGGN